MDSKRIKKLRQEIIKAVPKFPNNKGTKQELESKHLADLLVVYLNWASRLIVARPRKVEVESTVTSDLRWNAISSNFLKLKEKIIKGEDLIPHLSLKAQEKGYTPAASQTGAGADKWADKDFLLSIMGFYHFHLGEVQERGKNITIRSDEVIFASVDRFTFRAIGIFDHPVFDDVDPLSKKMSAERTRLWQLFDNAIAKGVPPGNVVVPTIITTSGHTSYVVHMAGEYAKIIKEVDSKLDIKEFVHSLYKETGIEPPRNPKFEWYLRGIDLEVFDHKTNFFSVFRYGIN